MKLHDIISISPAILKSILLEETKKIPGVSGQNIEDIKIDDVNCEINIFLTPFSLLSNIHAIASEIQSAINFYLSRQFDIDEGAIKINVIVTTPKGAK